MCDCLMKEKRNTTPHVILYYLSLNTCSDLYAHFHYELGPASYFTPGSPQLSENRLFGMYHASTPQNNKDVISQSLLDQAWCNMSLLCPPPLPLDIGYNKSEGYCSYIIQHSFINFKNFFSSSIQETSLCQDSLFM